MKENKRNKISGWRSAHSTKDIFLRNCSDSSARSTWRGFACNPCTYMTTYNEYADTWTDGKYETSLNQDWENNTCTGIARREFRLTLPSEGAIQEIGWNGARQIPSCQHFKPTRRLAGWVSGYTSKSPIMFPVQVVSTAWRVVVSAASRGGNTYDRTRPRGSEFNICTRVHTSL